MFLDLNKLSQWFCLNIVATFHQLNGLKMACLNVDVKMVLMLEFN